MVYTEQIQKALQLISTSKGVLVFTGAGISTESGISDYRSKGGLWKRFKPVTIQEFLASGEKREEYWKIKLELYESLRNAKPNSGHYAIAELENLGKFIGIVTQNIDGLHALAGSSKEKVLEIHGTNRETVCLSCNDITQWQETYDRLKSGDKVPRCLKCDGLLKPNTISFGQNLNQKILDQSFQWAKECDLVLTIGSSLVVEPAASIPRVAKSCGAAVIIITSSETPIDSMADVKFTNSAGEVLCEIIENLKNYRKIGNSI